MTDCIFCKIVNGEIPASKVYEDDKILSFIDINPVQYGHILVIPKAHYPQLEETPDEVVADIFIQSKKLMRVVKKATGADYVVLSVVGTEVPHLHIHLIPRKHNDGLAGFWPRGDSTEKERAAAATQIRAAL